MKYIIAFIIMVAISTLVLYLIHGDSEFGFKPEITKSLIISFFVILMLYFFDKKKDRRE